MAAIAVTLLGAKDIILAGMSEKEQENLFAWLSQINENECCACNWRFFHIIVNVALKKCGYPYDEAGMRDSLDFIESCYVGNGWYLDGVDAQADYYVPFGMHFYGLLYAIYMKEDDPERCERFIERALDFGKQFAYWFDEKGQSIPYGRSLTYRFAQSSFYTACVMAHIEPLPLGVMKGILVRNMQYWMNQQMFDNAGIFTIGYTYPNLTMAETYNAPGSPYWALKYFAILSLPQEDKFWTAETLPLPEMKEICSFPDAKMMIQRTAKGHAIMYPAGLQIGHVHLHMEEKYSKFAYSSKYGFSVMHSAVNYHEAAPDSVLCFEIDGHMFPRRTIHSFALVPAGTESDLEHADMMVSEWSPFTGIVVESKIIPTTTGHIRIHKIDSEYDCVAYDTGYSMPITDDTCSVKCLEGDGVEDCIVAAPNTNICYSKTKLPHVRYRIKKGSQIIRTEIVNV